MDGPKLSPARIEQMRSALATHHDQLGAFVSLSGLRPNPGSLANLELAQFPRSELVKAAYDQSAILYHATADHSFALTRVLVPPVQTIAPWMLCRGALETAAISCWLGSPDLDARQRVSRSYAFRYACLYQQERFARLHVSVQAAREVTARIDALERDALFLGFPKVVDKKGKRSGLAEEMPSYTDLVGEVLGRAKDYRLLCAVTHGNPWAMTELGFAKVDELGSTYHRPALNVLAAAYLITLPAECLARCLWERTVLYGFDRALLGSRLTTMYDDLGLTDGPRFWL